MKQFIYLDTDIVSSIIAQTEKGFVTLQTTESGSETTKSKDKTASAAVEISGNGGFWKILQAGAKVSLAGEFHSNNASQSSTKEIAEKILHDAAFDIAYGYIKPSKVAVGNQDYDEEGNYLEIKRYFDFVDFDYLEGLFAKGGIIDFVKKSSTELRDNKNARSVINKQYEDIAATIKAFRGLIPYNRMLISRDGYLIPLDDKYFRIDPANLGFKYGGEMTCVGMVTNIIGESTDPADSKNVFATIQYTANEALRGLLPTAENDLCILHPIAVYYGQ